MEGWVRSWTKVERPPAGFPPGRVIVLVEDREGRRRYALWEGGPVRLDALVTLVEREGEWVAA